MVLLGGKKSFWKLSAIAEKGLPFFFFLKTISIFLGQFKIKILKVTLPCSSRSILALSQAISYRKPAGAVRYN